MSATSRQCVLLCVTRCRSGLFFTVSYLVIYVQSFDNQLNLFTCERVEFIRARRQDTFKICSTDSIQTYIVGIVYIYIYNVQGVSWEFAMINIASQCGTSYIQDFKYLRSVAAWYLIYSLKNFVFKEPHF